MTSPLKLRSALSAYLVFGIIWALFLVPLIVLVLKGKHAENGVVVCAIGMVATLASIGRHGIFLSEDLLIFKTIFGNKVMKLVDISGFKIGPPARLIVTTKDGSVFSITIKPFNILELNGFFVALKERTTIKRAKH